MALSFRSVAIRSIPLLGIGLGVVLLWTFMASKKPGEVAGASLPSKRGVERPAEEPRERSGEGSTTRLIDKWAGPSNLKGLQVDASISSRITELVEAGQFREAFELVKGFEGESAKGFGIAYIWFKWAAVDRDEARKFLESGVLEPEWKPAAAEGLFNGMARNTAPEDVAWVSDFLVGNGDHQVVKTVTFAVAKLWVATGVVSPQEVIRWARANPGAKLPDWVQGLATAPKIAASYLLEGNIGQADLMNLALSSIDIARELEPMTAGANDKEMSPQAELRQKLSSLLNYSGEAMASVLGASDLSDYPMPEGTEPMKWFFSGVGAGLEYQDVGSVHAAVLSFERTELAELVWSRYVQGRVRLVEPQGMAKDTLNMMPDGGFRDQLVDAYVVYQMTKGFESLATAVNALPEGEVKDRYAAQIGNGLIKDGKPEEGQRWLDAVKDPALRAPGADR